MNIPGIQAVVGRFISANASTILTAGGVIGTCLTAATAAKAGATAMKRIDMEERERTAIAVANADSDEKHLVPDIELPMKEKIKIAAPLFLPPVLLGAATIASIVWANQISAKRAAALAAAYGMSQERLQQYKDKLQERLTGPKHAVALQEISQEQVDKNPPPNQVIIVEGGNVLCYDEYTGRYFRSTYQKLEQARNKVNDDLFQVQYASLTSFYDAVGLIGTSFSNDVGWNMATTGAMDIRITAVKSPETNEPCLSVDFVVPPRADFQQNY